MSTATLAKTSFARPELGEYSSIVCFKALVAGLEEALGEKAALISLIAAGRARGKQLAESLGLSGLSVAEVTPLIQKAIGLEGTRLCKVNSITEEGDIITVSCSETICSAGEEQGSSRVLSFTHGAIQGALEQMTGKRLRGKQVESVLRGGSADVLEFQAL